MSFEQYRTWAQAIDEGRMPEGLANLVQEMEQQGPAAKDQFSLTDSQ